jgi:hypothetical protein
MKMQSFITFSQIRNQKSAIRNHNISGMTRHWISERISRQGYSIASLIPLKKSLSLNVPWGEYPVLATTSCFEGMIKIN